MESQSKFQQDFFKMKIDNSKIYVWKMLREKKNSQDLKKENKFGGITLPHIRIYRKATIIKKL